MTLKRKENQDTHKFDDFFSNGNVTIKHLHKFPRYKIYVNVNDDVA